MENKNSKKEIVKMLLKKDINVTDEEDLINMLINEPISVDTDKESDLNRSFGDYLADRITEIAGSWPFIIGLIIFLLLWIILNIFILTNADPYPFILLNLLLSCIAALQAPIIMMSQNREAKKDRLRSSNDYKTDLKSELMLEDLHNKMSQIIKNQNKIINIRFLQGSHQSSSHLPGKIPWSLPVFPFLPHSVPSVQLQGGSSVEQRWFSSLPCHQRKLLCNLIPRLH